MNQPMSSCLTYYEDVIRSNAMLTPAGNLPPADNLDGLYQLEEPLSTDSAPHDIIMSGDSNHDDSSTLPMPLPFRESYPGAAQTFGRAATFMDIFDADLHAETRQQHLYYPFASREEWQLAAFLLRSGLSMNSIDKFLKLDLVSNLLLFLYLLTLESPRSQESASHFTAQRIFAIVLNFYQKFQSGNVFQ
jgi:hypothetical protein